MVEMLIVDDEKFAVDGICHSNDWLSLGIDAIHTAYHADEARGVMSGHRIDILICDIEMPDEDGLSLVRWVKEHSPHTDCIFLTCHAEFAYAKQAIHLGSFDYLLKPVDGEELARSVSRMLQALQEKQENARYNDMYRKYLSLWKKQQPLLAERFWQDLLLHRILAFGDFLERALQDAQIGLPPEGEVLPILVHIEEWKKPLDSRGQEVMEYAVKKAAAELFFNETPGDVILDKNGMLFVLAHGTEGSGGEAVWHEAGARFMEVCRDYFYCQVSCYVGHFVPLQELPRLCEELKNVATREMDGVVQKAIHYMKEHVEEDISRESVAAYVSLNPAYLSRLFKKTTGQNLIDYLIKTKMNHAKQLFDSSAMTVSAIAQQVGYCNFSHFTKMFKKQFGVNPQDYRNVTKRLE